MFHDGGGGIFDFNILTQEPRMTDTPLHEAAAAKGKA